MHLLDVNVLISLAWPNHEHHEVVTEWFQRNRLDGWATCQLTQVSFLRLSMNPRVVQRAVSCREAVDLLRHLVSLAGHVFWSDDVPIIESIHFPVGQVLGYRQVPDAYLLTLARGHGARLATTDRGLLSLVPRGATSSDWTAILV